MQAEVPDEPDYPVEDEPLEVMGEVIAYPSHAKPGFRPGYHADRRPPFRLRILDGATRVWGEKVGALASDLLEAHWRKQMPAPVVKLLLNHLLPEKPPPDISELPEKIETVNDWFDAVTGLYRLRREQRISDAEWTSMLANVTSTWRAICEAKAQRR